MEPPEQSQPLTPRRRRGLIIVMITALLLVLAIFLGLNLGHYQEMKQGEAAGNASGVPGPGEGS